MSFATKLATLNNTSVATQVAVETQEQKMLRLERLNKERQEEKKKRVAAEYARQLNELETVPATTKLRWEVVTALVWALVAHSLFGERAMKAIRDAVSRNPLWFSNVDVFWYIKKTKDVMFGQMVQEVFLEKMRPDNNMTSFDVIHYTMSALGATEAIAQIKSDAKDVQGAADEREALKALATYVLNNFDLPTWLYDQLLHYVEPTGVFKPKQSEFASTPQGEFQFVKLWHRPKLDPAAVARQEEIERITALPTVTLEQKEKKEKKEKKGLSPERRAFEEAKKRRNAQKPNPQALGKPQVDHGNPFAVLATLRDKLPSAHQNGTTHA